MTDEQKEAREILIKQAYNKLHDAICEHCEGCGRGECSFKEGYDRGCRETSEAKDAEIADRDAEIGRLRKQIETGICEHINKPYREALQERDDLRTALKEKEERYREIHWEWEQACERERAKEQQLKEKEGEIEYYKKCFNDKETDDMGHVVVECCERERSLQQSLTESQAHISLLIRTLKRWIKAFGDEDKRFFHKMRAKTITEKVLESPYIQAEVARIEKMEKDVVYWREKCFNDTMSAKKSGYDDAKNESKWAVKELVELLYAVKAKDWGITIEGWRKQNWFKKADELIRKYGEQG